MSFHVSVEIARLSKGLVTEFACEWFLACMSSNMYLEDVLSGKSDSAFFANEWSLIGMLALEVILKVAFSSETFQTFLALMRLNTFMAVDVVPETSLLIVEFTATFWTRILRCSFKLSKD